VCCQQRDDGTKQDADSNLACGSRDAGGRGSLESGKARRHSPDWGVVTHGSASAEAPPLQGTNSAARGTRLIK
jgi:hypothetical protein